MTERLEKIENILEKLFPTDPHQVEVQMYFVEYKMDDIEKLAREDKLEADSLLALWKKGDAKLLHAPLTRGEPRSKSTVKGITEYIYPTEVDVVIANTNSSAANPTSGECDTTEKC